MSHDEVGASALKNEQNSVEPLQRSKPSQTDRLFNCGKGCPLFKTTAPCIANDGKSGEACDAIDTRKHAMKCPHDCGPWGKKT